MFDEYYTKIVRELQKKFPPEAENIFLLAKENAAELYTQERALDAELNVLWDVDLDKFKVKVLSWGRVVLQILRWWEKEIQGKRVTV